MPRVFGLIYWTQSGVSARFGSLRPTSLNLATKIWRQMRQWRHSMWLGPVPPVRPAIYLHVPIWSLDSPEPSVWRHTRCGPASTLTSRKLPV